MQLIRLGPNIIYLCNMLDDLDCDLIDNQSPGRALNKSHV